LQALANIFFMFGCLYVATPASACMLCAWVCVRERGGKREKDKSIERESVWKCAYSAEGKKYGK